MLLRDMSLTWDSQEHVPSLGNVHQLYEAAEVNHEVHLEAEEDEPEASRRTLAVPVHKLMDEAADYEARHHAQSAQLHVEQQGYTLRSMLVVHALATSNAALAAHLLAVTDGHPYATKTARLQQQLVSGDQAAMWMSAPPEGHVLADRCSAWPLTALQPLMI
jgi:hypothetical protein